MVDVVEVCQVEGKQDDTLPSVTVDSVNVAIAQPKQRRNSDKTVLSKQHPIGRCYYILYIYMCVYMCVLNDDDKQINVSVIINQFRQIVTN